MPKAKPKPKTKQTEPVVSRESNLGEVVFNYPETAEILLDYGLHCVGCGAMHYDTIETGARIHGLSDTEIDGLVLRINEVIEFDE
jgi:hybrid cluster-associated redox disulfide protein